MLDTRRFELQTWRYGPIYGNLPLMFMETNFSGNKKSSLRFLMTLNQTWVKIILKQLTTRIKPDLIVEQRFIESLCMSRQDLSNDFCFVECIQKIDADLDTNVLTLAQRFVTNRLLTHAYNKQDILQKSINKLVSRFMNKPDSLIYFITF